MRIALVTPAQPGSRSGNETTTERWRQILERRGHAVIVLSAWEGEACDVLVALHAHKSLKSIERFRREHPHKPVIVALTGTDIYGDLATHSDPWRSLETAARLIVLQPLALLELPEPLRQKTRVIYQSVDPQELSASAGEHARDDAQTFDVCVMAHLREVKDPLRTAYAARLLPLESKIRVIHLGGGLSPEAEHEAREEMLKNPRFRWLGSVPRSVALARLAQSDLMVVSSLREGGANAVGEAIAAGVPIVASRIPGNVGLLGEDYEGYFPAGDEAALAELLWRLERDREQLDRLRAQCSARRGLFERAREEQRWDELLEEIVLSMEDAQGTVDRLSTLIGHAERDDRRRHRRVPVKTPVHIEMWLRGPRGPESLLLPVSILDVSPEGISMEMPNAFDLATEPVVAISLPLVEPALRVPARVAWTEAATAARGATAGVHFQLAAAEDAARKLYAEWMAALLHLPKLTQ